LVVQISVDEKLKRKCVKEKKKNLFNHEFLFLGAEHAKELNYVRMVQFSETTKQGSQDQSKKKKRRKKKGDLTIREQFLAQIQ
jgi:hypothetical protein